MNESSTISYLNKTKFFDLVKCKDSYSSYDASDNNYLVEIKNRRKYYKDKLIECSKLFINYQKAQLQNKNFIYVVTDNKGCWVYSITKNIDKIVSKKPVKIPCPSKTDFNGGKVIDKYCYTLTESMSKKI